VGNPIPTSQPCSSHLHYHRLLLKHNDRKTPCHRPMFVLHRFHICLLNMRTTFDRCTCIGIHAPKRHCRPCPAHPCMHALLPKTEDTLNISLPYLPLPLKLPCSVLTKHIPQLHHSHTPNLPFILHFVTAQAQTAAPSFGLSPLSCLSSKSQCNPLEVVSHTPLLAC
jgi:hypothetical protein